jgi:hypothetical protein
MIVFLFVDGAFRFAQVVGTVVLFLYVCHLFIAMNYPPNVFLLYRLWTRGLSRLD